MRQAEFAAPYLSSGEFFKEITFKLSEGDFELVLLLDQRDSLLR